MRDAALILTGGRVLQSGANRPEWLDVGIGRGGRIAALAPSLDRAPDTEVIDLGGKLVVHCALIRADSTGVRKKFAELL